MGWTPGSRHLDGTSSFPGSNVPLVPDDFYHLLRSEVPNHSSGCPFCLRAEVAASSISNRRLDHAATGWTGNGVSKAKLKAANSLAGSSHPGVAPAGVQTVADNEEHLSLRLASRDDGGRHDADQHKVWAEKKVGLDGKARCPDLPRLIFYSEPTLRPT